MLDGANAPKNTLLAWWNFQVNGWLRYVVGRRPVVTAFRAGLIVLLYFGVFRQVFQPIRVTGVSMEPTYHHGQIKLLNLLAYRKEEPARGDVVAIKAQDSLRVYLKRIAGLPGERVTVRGGRVFINGRVKDGSFAEGRGIPPMTEPMLLGPDQYFVIGDNRHVTAYQRVERHEILGRTR